MKIVQIGPYSNSLRVDTGRCGDGCIPVRSLLQLQGSRSHRARYERLRRARSGESLFGRPGSSPHPSPRSLDMPWNEENNKFTLLFVDLCASGSTEDDRYYVLTMHSMRPLRRAMHTRSVARNSTQLSLPPSLPPLPLPCLPGRCTHRSVGLPPGCVRPDDLMTLVDVLSGKPRGSGAGAARSSHARLCRPIIHALCILHGVH